jgi:phosphate uptake regulator
MDARKVLEMGGGTLLVSLPRDWARKNGVTKGSTLAVDALTGRKLIIRPIEDVTEKPREIVIDYPKVDFTHVLNDITGAYLLGYDVIRIRGDKVITREDREMLKGTLGRLVGLEIMDENAKNVSMQFLLEPSGINPERIARRMASIIEGMVNDTAEGVLKGDGRLLSLVAERDDEVDRLYFLLVRTVRTATIRVEVAESYGLAPVDVLDYRVLASFLESVGDAVTELSIHLQRETITREVARKYSACISKLSRLGDLAFRAFMSRKAQGSKNLYTEVQALSSDITASLAEIARHPQEKQAAAVETLGTVARANRLYVDISDLAVPTQSSP